MRHRHHANSRSYILTGRAVCKDCGRAIVGTSGTSQTATRYSYYKCTQECTGRIPADLLEDTVVNALTDYISRCDCAAIAKKAYDIYTQDRLDNTERKAAEAELKDVEKKLENAVNAVLSGISSSALQNKMTELEKRKIALKNEISRLEKSMPDLKPEHFEYFVKRLAKLKDTDIDRIQLIDTLVSKVIVSRDDVTILINLSDKTKTPPLQHINAALEACSLSVACGGRYATQEELIIYDGMLYVAINTFLQLKRGGRTKHKA